MKNIRVWPTALLILWSVAADATTLSVAVRPAFFNPSLGQKVAFEVTVGKAGQLVAAILDRDRVVVRALPSQAAQAGAVTLAWDGRDDSGTVVPNEAYSLRITLSGDGFEEIYDPSEGFTPSPTSIGATTYSRASGVLSYSVPTTARVHIQAGQAKMNSATGQAEGPVLKTLVDREPRVAGAVIEKWNGLDESGRIYIPDLPDFVVAVLATPLPENAIITVGSRGPTFAAYVLATRPREATLPRALRGIAHGHHAGLNALEDRSPRVAIEAATQLDSATGVWQATPGELPLRITIDSAQAPYFFSQATALSIFVDSKRVVHVAEPENPAAISIPARDLRPGEHRIVANWISKSGPVGVSVIRVLVPSS